MVGECEQPGAGKTFLTLGPFGLAVQEVSAIDSNMLRGPKRCLTVTGVNFRPMPSM